MPSGSRRGATYRVKKVLLTFEDGDAEQWEFPPEQPAFYREGRNSVGEGKSYRGWREHSIWWQSEQTIPAPDLPVESISDPKPILDEHERPTGWVAE